VSIVCKLVRHSALTSRETGRPRPDDARLPRTREQTDRNLTRPGRMRVGNANANAIRKRRPRDNRDALASFSEPSVAGGSGSSGRKSLIATRDYILTILRYGGLEADLHVAAEPWHPRTNAADLPKRRIVAHSLLRPVDWSRSSFLTSRPNDRAFIGPTLLHGCCTRCTLCVLSIFPYRCHLVTKTRALCRSSVVVAAPSLDVKLRYCVTLRYAGTTTVREAGRDNEESITWSTKGRPIVRRVVTRCARSNESSTLVSRVSVSPFAIISNDYHATGRLIVRSIVR